MIAPSSSNGRYVEQPPAAVGENIANLAQDMLTLGELQAKLFWIDFESARNRSVLPAIALIGGACILLGTTPVLLSAIAEACNRAYGWDMTTAKFIVAGTSLGLSMVAMWWAVNRLALAGQLLMRSRAEFQENLSWIKNVIRQSMTPTRK